MLKENKLPIINDNVTKEELDEMVNEMLKNGPIDLREHYRYEIDKENKNISIA